MPNPNFVCTICSQTFTRKWRGIVHRDNLHGGAGDIVRLIDYMVGRTNGQYSPGDPSLYRRRIGKISGDLHNNNPIRPQTSSGEMGDSFGQENKNTNTKWTFNKKNIDQGRYSQPSGISSTSDGKQQQQYHISDNRPFSDSIQQPNEAIIKMAELKRLLSKYLPPQKVQEILSSVCEFCRIMGDNSTLDTTLEEARKKVQIREASDYLNNS